MKFRLAIAASIAVAILLTAQAADAAHGHAGFGFRGHVAAGPGAAHFAHPRFHGGTRVFIGGTFVAWPGYYYPAPYYYAQPVAAPVTYWYYCAAIGAYYPYVRDCPSGWQLVPAYAGY